MARRKKPSYLLVSVTHSSGASARKLRVGRETLKELIPSARTAAKDVVYTAKCVTFSGPVGR